MDIENVGHTMTTPEDIAWSLTYTQGYTLEHIHERHRTARKTTLRVLREKGLLHPTLLLRTQLGDQVVAIRKAKRES